MQTFSNMQRSIPNQKPVTPLLYIIFFVIYSSLSSVYIVLPPLLAVLFVLYSDAIKKDNFLLMMFISFCLVIFEANKGYPIFSSIIYFTLVYKFIIPKIIKNFSCNSCVKISYVLLAYVGYYLFLMIIAKIFLLPQPNFDYYVIYYVIIEFLFVSLL